MADCFGGILGPVVTVGKISQPTERGREFYGREDFPTYGEVKGVLWTGRFPNLRGVA